MNLYDNYNVKGVIDMSGDLYKKQGTSYPTRMILIDGRRSEQEKSEMVVYPPVQSKALRKAESFDDLYDIVNELQLKTLIDESEADVTFIYDESVDNIVDSEVYSDLCEALDTLDEIDYEVDDQDPSCLAVWEK